MHSSLCDVMPSASAPLLGGSVAARAASTRNFRVVLFTTFLACCMYALIFPSMALFLRRLDAQSGAHYSAASESTFLGYLVGGYSLTKFLLSPAAGALAGRSGGRVRAPLLGAVACLGAGSLLYGCARSRYELLGARLLIGVSGVSSTLARTAVAREARLNGPAAVNGRTAALTMATSVGFIAGPALGAAVAGVRFVTAGGTVIDALNLPGFISCGLALINGVLLLFAYREEEATTGGCSAELKQVGLVYNTASQNPTQASSAAAAEEEGHEQDEQAEKAAAKAAADASRRRTLLPFLALLLLQFVIVTPFSAFESVTTPYCVGAYGWGVARIGTLFALGSAIAVPAAMVLRPITRKRTAAGPPDAVTGVATVVARPPLMGDSALMGAGMLLMVAALVLMTNVSEGGGDGTAGSESFVPWMQFSAGMLLFYCGYVAAQTMLFAVLIKLLTGNGVPAGTRIGLVSACGSVARVVGPVWAMDLYADDNTGRLVFLVNAAVVGVGLPVLYCSRKSFHPQEEEGEQQQQQQQQQ